MDNIIFGLDLGTTKVCAIVGEVREGQLRIIGLGETKARGMRKGMVTDVVEATQAIAAAIEEAEQTSGCDLSQVVVGIAGEHIQSTNCHGMTRIGRNGTGIQVDDVERALDAAQAISLPPNRQIVHLVPRHFTVDDQEGVRNPLGMHGYKLEVEAHVITAASPAIMNLRRCTDGIDLHVEEHVLNVLAAGEAVLEQSEREMGVILADIGGGTTDIALYMQGMVWHTQVLPIGGSHITNDIAIGLRVPAEIAEQVKLRYGDCQPKDIDPDSIFSVRPFGGEMIRVGRQDLAYVIEARVEEMFQMVLQDIKRSGYDGLLPAGIVLTGGTAQLRGISKVAERVLGVPARVAAPRNVLGMVESLQNPSHATSVGLLRWMMSGHSAYRPRPRQNEIGRRLGNLMRILLP